MSRFQSAPFPVSGDPVSGDPCTRTVLSPETGLFHLPQDFQIRHGGQLKSAVLAYELHGAIDGPVVLVQGGISSGRHVWHADAAGHEPAGEESPGWFDAQVGPGKAIDTRHYRVLGIDWLGGSGASTGPGTTSQRPFPAVTSTDQAVATSLLLEHLRIARLHAFVGASYGAMVGLAFASLFPAQVERLIAISGAHVADPLSTAWRSLQRRIVQLGMSSGAAHEAAVIARGLAMTTYRSRAEFAGRFAAAPAGVVHGKARFPVEDYLEARGQSFASAIDPESFVLLSQAIDLHAVDPTTITTPTTVVAVESDLLVPLQQSEELFSQLAGRKELVVLASRFGHDAFLTEPAAISAVLQRAVSAALVAGEVTP